MLEGWGSGLKRIFSQCEEYGIPYPVFVEIGDMLRVNFYRPSYKNIGDKSAIKQDIGDKSATNYKGKILEYLEEHAEARTQEISLYIGLKLSRTKDYLSELVEEGNIIANGANKNRTYSLKKQGHAKPWKDCTNDAELLNIFNGFLLTANLDALFDKGYISFTDEGLIMVSSVLNYSDF